MAICKQCKQENKGKYELCYNCFTSNKNKTKPKDELSVFKSGNSKEVQQVTINNKQQLNIFRSQCLDIAGDMVVSTYDEKPKLYEEMIKEVFEIGEKLYQEGKRTNWLNRL